MELTQLIYFKTLCQYKSFSKAANVLFVSPSTITLAIQKLESELNSLLIIRSNKTFILTPTGNLLLECAEKVCGNVDAFQSSLIPNYGNQNLINLGLAAPLASIRMITTIDSFKEVNPQITYSFERKPGGTICQMVNAGSLDIGIVLSKHLDIRNLEYILYEKMEYCVFVSAMHKWARLDSITPNLLKTEGQNIINYQGGTLRATNIYLAENGIEPFNNAFRSVFIESSIHFVANQNKLAILPKDCRMYDNVVCIPLDPPLFADHLIVYNRLKPPKESVQQLIAYLIEHPYSS